jgi:hypothetical protein
MASQLATATVGFAASPPRQDGVMTDTTEELAAELAPIRVRFDSIRWEVDFGGGISQRFSDRDEAITSARRAAASEDREVQIDA